MLELFVGIAPESVHIHARSRAGVDVASRAMAEGRDLSSAGEEDLGGGPNGQGRDHQAKTACVCQRMAGIGAARRRTRKQLAQFVGQLLKLYAVRLFGVGPVTTRTGKIENVLWNLELELRVSSLSRHLPGCPRSCLEARPSARSPTTTPRAGLLLHGLHRMSALFMTGIYFSVAALRPARPEFRLSAGTDVSTALSGSLSSLKQLA
jgi:hypothetical protein